jgi:glucosamine--fructose-6-phosphate aminotransferase (isomerizing)
MCGIAAYVGKKQPINKLMFLMFDNDSRGGHSSGAYIDKSIYKCTEKSGNLLHMIKESNAELFIGHTRYATHGSTKANNTHPYTYGKYTGVHNGVLSNYEDILKKNNLANVDVDSKAIYKVLSKTNNYKTLGEYSGTINAVWTENNDKLYVYRRNNPLFRLRQNGGIFFSSIKEGLQAIANKAKDVKEVAKNKLFIYNSNGDLVNTINIKVTAQEYVGKNWYDYKSNHNNILTYNDYESYENPNQINIWDNPNEYLSEEETIEFEYETSMLLQEKLNFFKEYDVYTPEEIKQIEKLIAIINEKYWEF